jgi:hypothetical protein
VITPPFAKTKPHFPRPFRNWRVISVMAWMELMLMAVCKWYLLKDSRNWGGGGTYVHGIVVSCATEAG